MTNQKLDITPQEIISFWCEAGAEKWFAKDDAFDREIEKRFASLVAQAGEGGLRHWRETAPGCLALVLLLDQFTRNIFRGQAKTWAFDPLALEIAEVAIARGFDFELSPAERRWLYMPHMHAEDMATQERSIELSARAENPGHLKFAILHKDVIERFGRFPHRNKVLNRASTPEEERYLADGGFAA